MKASELNTPTKLDISHIYEEIKLHNSLGQKSFTISARARCFSKDALELIKAELVANGYKVDLIDDFRNGSYLYIDWFPPINTNLTSEFKGFM